LLPTKAAFFAPFIFIFTEKIAKILQIFENNFQQTFEGIID
jgi:hypothetical protein